MALDAQDISKKSKILTVTRMTHAGGLLTQTLPAYSIGAEFKVQQFNAFTFLKLIKLISGLSLGVIDISKPGFLEYT